MGQKKRLLLAADQQVPERWKGRGTLRESLPFLTEATDDDHCLAERQIDAIRVVAYCEPQRHRFAEAHYGQRDFVVILRDGTPVLTINKVTQDRRFPPITVRPAGRPSLKEV